MLPINGEPDPDGDIVPVEEDDHLHPRDAVCRAL